MVQGTMGSGLDRHAASANLFNFRGKRQLSISGDLNNTNTRLFDLDGAKKGPDLFADKQEGITTARALGINYRDVWSKKITFYGSYTITNNSVYTNASIIRDNLSGELPSTEKSNNTMEERNLNHRLNFNLEYKPDTLNYFLFIPNFVYRGVRADETFASRLVGSREADTLLSDYTGTRETKSSSPNFSLQAIYNRKFRKRGGNINIQLSAGSAIDEQYEHPTFRYLSGNASAPVSQLINAFNRTDSAGASLSYLEPLGKKSHLEFNYRYYNAKTDSERLIDTISNKAEVLRYPELSSDQSFKFITNRFGLNYRLRENKSHFTLGIAFQPTLMKGLRSSDWASPGATFDLSPVLRYVYNFTDLQALVFSLQGAATSPNYQQLLPMINFSNANYPVQGNPGLLPEYSNTFQIRYNKFGDGTGRTFFSTLSIRQTNRKIVSDIINYPKNYLVNAKLAGTILTGYRNASGFYNASANYILLGVWAKRKYTWMLNGNLSYANHISYLTDVADDPGEDQTVQKNMAKNLVFAQGGRIRVDIADKVDTEVSANYLISYSNNSISAAYLNNSFQTVTLGANGHLSFLRGWTLSYQYSKPMYIGYQGATNPDLLDTYLEYRFSEKNPLILRLSAFDIFNENTGFTASQNAFSITQRNVNRLGRYFLFSITARLQKFAGRLPRAAPRLENNGG